MRDDAAHATARSETFDSVAEELQRLRARAGHISYAQIVSRIFDARLLTDPGARPPGRSTVYDTFKFGRQRVDVALVLEIARALGADAAGCHDLEQRCATVRIRLERGAPSGQGGTPTTLAAALPATAGATPSSTSPAGRVPGVARPRRWGVYLLVALAAVCLNTLGHGLVAWLGLPLYLDMLGTGIVAIALGPWWGAAVGLATNLVAVPFNSEASIPFAAVNVVGALVWGYGVRSFGLGKTLPRFFTLNLLVALTCTVTAVPILVLLFNGDTGHSGESLTGTFSLMGETLVLAVFSSNLVSSVADKLIAGFVALVIVGSLGRWIPAPAGVLWATGQSFGSRAHPPVATTERPLASTDDPSDLSPAARSARSGPPR